LKKQLLGDIEKMFELNVIVYGYLTNLVLPYMKKKNSGRIINISSIVTVGPLPFLQHTMQLKQQYLILQYH